MARRYARDNRGRFASGGGGATARGGRLRTAAGNKRKTQTMQASAAPKGTIGKPRGLKPQSAKPAPSAATIAQVGRERRATRNLNAAMKREAEGPGSKASRSASVAKRARAIYAGKVDPKQKTAARLTRTNNPEALRKRIKKIKDNNAAKSQQKANIAARKTAKPVATTTKLGSRLNPAKKADRAATRKFEQAYERENRIRSSLFRGNKSLQTRQAITKELDKASNLTKTMQMQRRGIRAQFPVQTKDKALSVAGSRRSGTISRNKDVRNSVNRREAFKRKVNRAGALSRPGNDRKAQRTAQVRAKAMATYQGARRPEISDSTVGRFGKSRTSTAFRAPASRLASPSRAARRQGRALAIAQKPIRDQFGRRIGNPKKQQRSKKTGSRALSFYQNPKAAAQSVLRDRGNRGLSTKGFRKPRAAATAKPAAPKPAAKQASKAATSLQAVNARRARASAPRTSTYLSQKLNTQSAITRSAANAIYNRQRAVGKAGGLDQSVIRSPIGIMPKTSGSVRNRAEQVREAARKRVVAGRRR